MDITNSNLYLGAESRSGCMLMSTVGYQPTSLVNCFSGLGLKELKLMPGLDEMVDKIGVLDHPVTKIGIEVLNKGLVNMQPGDPVVRVVSTGTKSDVPETYQDLLKTLKASFGEGRSVTAWLDQMNENTNDVGIFFRVEDRSDPLGAPNLFCVALKDLKIRDRARFTPAPG